MLDTLVAPTPRRGRTPRPGRWHRVRRVLAVAMVSFLLVTTVSYVRALTYPGNATFLSRSAGWVRDHGGDPLVNILENWYYTRHAPSTNPPPLSSLPPAPATTGGNGPVTLPGSAGLPGEGRWAAGRPNAQGQPAAYTTFIQPDPAHASVVAGVAWIRAGATTAHLVAGTAQPNTGRWPGGGRISPADVAGLVATFNSGWKLQDISGGFFVRGQTAGALRPGQASLMVDDTGAITVGAWGRDVVMTPHTVAVRQNLALVVDRGAPVAGLVTNAAQLWGSASNQLQFTWRSGVGVDAAGNVIYVAGDGLTLATLADALTQAGAVRAMQLDIHPGMAFYASWAPSGPVPSGPVPSGSAVAPTKLLASMPGSAQRYLAPDQRDFLYLTLR